MIKNHFDKIILSLCVYPTHGLSSLLRPLPFIFLALSLRSRPLLIFTGREGRIIRAIPKYGRLGSSLLHRNEMFLLIAIVAGSPQRPLPVRQSESCPDERVDDAEDSLNLATNNSSG